MPTFSRAFRNLARMFPGAGNWQGPSTVSNTVAFVEPLSRPSIAHDLIFKNDHQTAATGGVATTLTHAEPPQGYIHIPIQWAISYDGVAQIQVETQIFGTTSATEQWGRWVNAGVTRDIATYRIASIVGASPDQLMVTAFPYMRGCQLRVVFPAPAAATNVAASLYVIEMPIECATIDTWKPIALSMMWTRALP